MTGHDLQQQYPGVWICNAALPLDGANTAHYKRATPRSHWRLEALTVGYDISDPAYAYHGAEYADVVFHGSAWLPPASSRSLPTPSAV
jgi:hypothetical protein